MSQTQTSPRPRHRLTTLSAVRYGLPALIVLVGIVFVAVDPSSWEGAAGLIGAGLSVSLLNILYRMGVDGDVDRVTEEDARDYYDAHGRWPDEPQRPPRRSDSNAISSGTASSSSSTSAR